MTKCFDKTLQLPRLKKCCCCLSLRTGSLAIGYVSMILSALLIIATCLSLYAVVQYVETHKNGNDPYHNTEKFHMMALSLYILHAYLFFVYLYYFTINILLVIGVHKNKTNLMRYYFTAGLLMFCMASISVVLSTIFLHLVVTVSLLKLCVLISYCLVIVRSTFLEIEERNKPRDYEMQNLYNPLRIRPLAL